MADYDVIIVGGGPAGSTLGYQLKKAGMNCCIIDRAVFPRKKLCGGLLTRKTVRLLEQLYGKPFTVYRNQVRTVSFYAGMERKLLDVSADVPFYLADREEFDDYLLRQYKNLGGEVREGIRIARVDAERDTVVLKDGEELTYRWLVGADGAASIIRREVDPTFKPSGFCVEINPELSCGQDSISLYLGAVNSGYGWVFPKGKTATIGVGGLLKENPKMVERFEEYLNCIPYEKTGEPVKGAPVAYGNYVEKPAKGNILLIGDAAGLVDPLTGEGIYFAILSGRYAFGAIRGKDPVDDYLRKTRKIHKVIREMNLAKRLFFSRALHPLCLRAIEKNPGFIAYVLEHLVSEYDTAVPRLPFDYFVYKRKKRWERKIP